MSAPQFGNSRVHVMRWILPLLLTASAATSVFPTIFPAATAQQQAVPQPPAAAAPAEDGQWRMPAKNFASTRYSELDEINVANVKSLQVAFTFSTGVNKGHEAAPLVVGSTMYIVT